MGKNKIKKKEADKTLQISILQGRISQLNSVLLAETIGILTVFSLILSSKLSNIFFDFVRNYLFILICCEILFISYMSILSRLYFIKIEHLKGIKGNENFLKIRIRDIFKINPS